MKIQQYVFALLICCLLFLSTCTGYKIKEPPIGITYKFYSHKPQEIRPNSKYDFSRLQNGYGLVIFSYDLEGFKGYRIVNVANKQGLRIWEYKFIDTDENEKIVTERVNLFSYKSLNNTGAHSASAEKDVKKDIAVSFTFLKNKIVYGGRIFASDYENRGKIFNNFDEDCSQFLTTYSSYLTNIPIDTVFMKVSKPSPKEKKEKRLLRPINFM